MSVDGVRELSAVRPQPIGPVIIAVYLGVKQQFGQEKVNYRPRHVTIIVAELVAVLVGEQGLGGLQFVNDEFEHLRPLYLFGVG